MALEPKTAPTPTMPSASSPGTTQTQTDAFAYIKGIFAQYGLPDSLATWAWNEIVAGKDQNQVLLDLQNTPEFKARFPAIDAQRKAGMNPISPGEYVTYENTARDYMRAAGLPAGFYDSNKDFTTLISNGVSLTELNERVQEAKAATYQIDPQTRDRLWHEFGLAPGSGDLTAYFLDPTKAQPLLQQKFLAAQIGGAADQTGYAGLSDITAEQLAAQGVTASQAQQGFTDLAKQSELFQGLIGQGESDIGQQTQLGAEFSGNAADQQVIQQRQRSRLAQFGGSSQIAQTSSGAVGLRNANT